jgi:uncharacterized membrane protein YkoI
VNRTTKLTAAGAVAGIAVAIASGVAVAGGGDDSEPAITGRALEQASAAALAHTGQGRVRDTEVGDEDSYYEVEVTLDDGSHVDVQLDKQFKVVDTKTDRDSREDENSDDD